MPVIHREEPTDILTIKCDACGHPWQGQFKYEFPLTRITAKDGIRAELQLIPMCSACKSIALKFGVVKAEIVTGKEG